TLQFYIPIDTITCFQPSISLDCYSPTPFTTVNWSDSTGQSNLGTSLIVSSQDTLWIHVVNDTNGCETIREIRIAENIAKPHIFIDQFLNINCSNDSVVLSGNTAVFDTSLVRSGNSLFSTSNSTWASFPGYYSLTVNWNFNGCSKTDSVLVIADNSI